MKTYQERVEALEAEGLTTSDAQGAVDAEMMREGRHTQGPWQLHETTDKTANNHKWHVFSANGGGAIASHFFQYTYGEAAKLYEDFSEARANARLIAAAPELLEALELIAGLQRGEKPDWQDLVYKAKDLARAAIAKARGNHEKRQFTTQNTYASL